MTCGLYVLSLVKGLIFLEILYKTRGYLVNQFKESTQIYFKNVRSTYYRAEMFLVNQF
jgi:hypothetical protein